MPLPWDAITVAPATDQPAALLSTSRICTCTEIRMPLNVVCCAWYSEMKQTCTEIRPSKEVGFELSSEIRIPGHSADRARSERSFTIHLQTLESFKTSKLFPPQFVLKLRFKRI